MVKLPRIKVDIIKRILTAREYNVDTKAMRKPCFIVYPSARSALSMSEICYHKAGPTYLGNDLIINLVNVLGLIYSYWFVSYSTYCWAKAEIPSFIHGLVEPHSDKSS